uniref:Integrase n=1 Tax=Streptomyces sp. NBC_00049 TaxID=2903617 RepID=A0AAU2K023_9ACTN
MTWRRCGVGGQELRPGTKSFKGGAKVYVAHVYWGPGGERVTVIGRERHTGRWIAIDTATRHLHGFRPKLVHTPRVLERLNETGRHRGFDADYAATASATLEQYARRFRANIASSGPHPDRCLCHVCLTGESASATADQSSRSCRNRQAYHAVAAHTAP